VSHQPERSRLQLLQQLFYRAQPLRGLCHGYPVFELNESTVADPLPELEELAREVDNNDADAFLRSLVQRTATLAVDNVIQRTHPLAFVNNLQDGLAGCITFFQKNNTAAMSLFVDQLVPMTLKAIESHQTGCRPEYEKAIAEVSHLVKWLKEGRGDLEPSLKKQMKNAAASLSEYRDHLARRIPQLDTHCQIGAGKLADLFRERMGKELDLESEIESAEVFRDSMLKRLRRECGTFHQRFQTETEADPVQFALNELNTDSPKPEEIPLRLQQLVRRLLRFQEITGLTDKVLPPLQSGYLEFVSQHFRQPRLMGPGMNSDFRIRLSPLPAEKLDHVEQVPGFTRLEIEAIRIAAQHTLISSCPLSLSSDFLPDENRRGFELMWLQTLQGAGWGKGDIRLRIGADLILLQEAISYIAMLQYHGRGEDDQTVLDGLVQGSCFSREEALVVVTTLKSHPFSVGSGFPVFRELKRLQRYHKRKLPAQVSEADFYRLLFTGALLPIASLSRFVSTHLRKHSNTKSEISTDGADQHV